jgi:hypothetical protein
MWVRISTVFLHSRFVIEGLIGLRLIIDQGLLHARAALLFLIRKLIEGAQLVPRTGLLARFGQNHFLQESPPIGFRALMLRGLLDLG